MEYPKLRGDLINIKYGSKLALVLKPESFSTLEYLRSEHCNLLEIEENDNRRAMEVLQSRKWDGNVYQVTFLHKFSFFEFFGGSIGEFMGHLAKGLERIDSCSIPPTRRRAFSGLQKLEEEPTNMFLALRKVGLV